MHAVMPELIRVRGLMSCRPIHIGQGLQCARTIRPPAWKGTEHYRQRAHAGTLWLGNAAYLYLSVSFIQMLKALMPVAVFCTGCTFGIESFSVGALGNMARFSSACPVLHMPMQQLIAASCIAWQSLQQACLC